MRNRQMGTLVLTLGALGVGCGSSGSNNSSGKDGGTDATTPDSTSPDGSQPTPDGTAPDTSAPTEGGADANADGAAPDGKAPDGAAPDGAAPDSTAPDSGVGTSVLMYHGDLAHDGHYVDALMTPTYAAGLALDPTFDGTITTPLWGQPLYVANGVGGKGTFYVANDANDIYAIDETSGKPDWTKTTLVTPASATGACGGGDPAPIGVTGTPVIDITSRTMYFSAAVATAAGNSIKTHEIHALSIDTGDEVTGWPIDVATLALPAKTSWNPMPQENRGALTLLNGYLYVPYGGENGDCDTYYGLVVAIPVATPTMGTVYATATSGGGIWSAAGLASDGTDVFAGTGNKPGGSTGAWALNQTEAILRFHNGSAFDATKTTDFFAPSNWQTEMDAHDQDLAAAGPIVVTVPGATPSTLIAQASKTGVLHLLDLANLGGVGTGDGVMGEGVYSNKVSNAQMRATGTSFTNSTATYVIVNGGGANSGSDCPGGTSGDLIAVKIAATSPPTFSTVWCASTGGTNGSPIVTTTDAAGDNPIVWVVGTEGSNQLTGWNGETGAPIFNGGGITMGTVQHFTTLIDVNGRLIVGANDKLYAFKGK